MTVAFGDHIAGAEQTPDGKWIPVCEHCNVIDPSVVTHYATAQLAVSAATTILRMVQWVQEP